MSSESLSASGPIYQSRFPFPASIPSNVNCLHILKGDTKDERWTSKDPLYIDVVTDQRRTLSEFFQRVDYLAAGLLSQTGIDPKSKELRSVGVLAPNDFEYPTCIYACFRMSVPFCAMSSYSTPREIAHFIKSGYTSSIIVHPSLWSRALEAAKLANFPLDRFIFLTTNDERLPENLPIKIPTTIKELVERGKKLSALPPAFVPPHQLAWIVFSSGTTALPKAVPITHKNAIANFASVKVMAEMGIKACEKTGNTPIFKPGERVIILASIPMYHAYGLLTTVIRPVLAQVTVCIFPKWDFQRALDAVPKYKITSLLLVPPIVHQLLNSAATQKADFSSVRVTSSGGAYLSQSAKDRMSKLLKERGARTRNQPPKVVTGYGMSECVVSITADSIAGMPSGPSKPGSVGVLQPGIKARIVDMDGKDVPRGQAGELIIQGDVVFPGYLNNPNTDTFLEPGHWLRTGDEFRIDEDGVCFYIDRLKDIFKSRGLQVSPTEISTYLHQNCPLVNTAVINGMPASDENYKAGEEAWAWILLSDIGNERKRLMGEEKVAEEIKELIGKNFARHKWLAKIIFVDSLPSTASGKLLSRQLKTEWLEKIKKNQQPQARL